MGETESEKKKDNTFLLSPWGHGFRRACLCLYVNLYMKGTLVPYTAYAIDSDLVNEACGRACCKMGECFHN